MSRLHFYVGARFTVPGLDLFTFWSRKHAGGEIAAQNGCLATINELALAARAPGNDFHHCVLLGHSFGGLELNNTISHSATVRAIAARGTWPWRSIRQISPSAGPAVMPPGDLQLRGQTFLVRIRNLVPFIHPVDDDRMPNTDPYEAA
jgi:hypothetical protein